MPQLKKRIYAEIAKVEDQDDGTIKVWGYASSGAVDSDGETVTPECMKAALPDYMKFGAVREMHQPMAAGTAIEATVEPDGKTWFGAHVVDPVAVKKVQTGVYKGFSIGGKVTERDSMNKNIIKGLKLVEVSLVDRPANPEAVFMVAKAETTPEDDVVELAELLDAGDVSPAGVLELIKAAMTLPPGTSATQVLSNYVVPTGAVSEEPVEEAAKAATTGSLGSPPKGGVTTPEPVQAEPKPADVVQKGMYQVSRLAELMESIAYLCQSTEWEAQMEADGSPVPAELRAWLKSGADIFEAMATEEIDELVDGVLDMADKADSATLTKEQARDERGRFAGGAGGSGSVEVNHDNARDARGTVNAARRELRGAGYRSNGDTPMHGTARMQTFRHPSGASAQIHHDTNTHTVTVGHHPGGPNGNGKAEATGDVAKAGARFSKSTKEALGAIHDACKAACGHLDGLKYADDSVEEADNAVDTTKAAAADDTAGSALVEQINKAVSTAIAPLNDELVKLRKDKEELSAKLNAMPAPGKALLRAVAISKAQDSQDDNATQTTELTPPPENTPERASWEMRKAYAQRAGKRFEG